MSTRSLNKCLRCQLLVVGQDGAASKAHGLGRKVWRCISLRPAKTWVNSTEEYGNQPGPPCPRQSMKCVLLLWEQKWLGSEGDVFSLKSGLDVAFF